MPPKGWKKPKDEEPLETMTRQVVSGATLVTASVGIVELRDMHTIRRCPGGHPVDNPNSTRCPVCSRVLEK